MYRYQITCFPNPCFLNPFNFNVVNQYPFIHTTSRYSSLYGVNNSHLYPHRDNINVMPLMSRNARSADELETAGSFPLSLECQLPIYRRRFRFRLGIRLGQSFMWSRVLGTLRDVYPPHFLDIFGDKLLYLQPIFFMKTEMPHER